MLLSSCAFVSWVTPATAASWVRDCASYTLGLQWVAVINPFHPLAPRERQHMQIPQPEAGLPSLVCAGFSVLLVCLDQPAVRAPLLEPLAGCGFASGEMVLPVRQRSRQGSGACAPLVPPLLMDAGWASPSLMGQ